MPNEPQRHIHTPTLESFATLHLVISVSSLTLLRAGRAVLVSLTCASLAAAQPIAPRRPVIDRYPSTTITDAYRWMERNGAQEFADWLTAQDAFTTRELARLPGRSALATRVRAEVRPDDAPRRVRRGGQRLFYLKRDADSLAPTLRWYDLETHIEQPIPLSAPIARHDPSPDGELLAVTLAEHQRTHLLSTRDGRVVDSLPNGASLAGWAPDGRALFYVQVESGTPVVRSHSVGDSRAPDRLVLRAGRGGAPRWRNSDAVIWDIAASGAVALRILRDESVIALYSRPALGNASTPAWQRVASPRNEVTDAAWHAGRLFMLGRDGLTRFDPATRRTDTVRSADGRALLSIEAAHDALYLLDGTAAQATLWRWRADSERLDSVPLPIAGSGRSLFASHASAGVVLPIDRWLGDGGWYLVSPSATSRLSLTAESRRLDRFLVEQRMVRSHDGTFVPMTIVRRRDLAPDSVRMTWLMAYGAYGIAMTPLYQSLNAALIPFLEDGGVYAVAHVRGGGEFGKRWHDDGRAANKPNGYRDLIACAEALIAARLAKAASLVIEGSSGGGATVGMAAMTRPELFRVVVTNVPDANTLRLHATPDGPYMREEWGDIRTRAGTSALAAMDVTHHVRGDVVYPAWMATTGLLDESVPPWQPAKLIATLQARRALARPTLLRVFPEEGHVFRPAAQIEQVIDMLSFAWWQTGARAFQPPQEET